MKAEIISIGTELLLGQITDTNASYIAGNLPGLGIDLFWISQVGDNQSRLVEVLKKAWTRSDIIITTGGLGPTEDDITREAIAEMLGEELTVDPALEKEVREFFSQRGWPMTENNLKQASLTPSAMAIMNPRGTAPGWWVERDEKLIIAMPGPPTEMQRMWEREVYPRLRHRTKGEVIVSRTLKTLGLAEAAVDEKLGPLLKQTNPSIGVYAKIDGIHLRLTAKAGSAEEAGQRITHREKQVREILADQIWGVDEETLESVIGSLLLERKLHIATMESCTGGLLANTFTDAAGSSAYFRGGIVAYSNEIKVTWGVPGRLIEAHGAVSREVAAAMASAIRVGMGADIGVSTTGVAGPDEIEGKPVGLIFVGIDDGVRLRVCQGNFPPRRPDVKRRGTSLALFELRKLLLNE